MWPLVSSAGGGFLSAWSRDGCMPKVNCPDCGSDIAMHELEAKTVAQSSGFSTRYRCPFCRTDMDQVDEHIV